MREATAEPFFVDFLGFSALLRSLRTLESTAPASKNEGSALRFASRVARALRPRKTTKIGLGIHAEAPEMPEFPEVPACPEPLGAPEPLEFPESPERNLRDEPLDEPPG